jgi:hypothetical protein
LHTLKTASIPPFCKNFAGHILISSKSMLYPHRDVLLTSFNGWELGCDDDDVYLKERLQREYHKMHNPTQKCRPAKSISKKVIQTIKDTDITEKPNNK